MQGCHRYSTQSDVPPPAATQSGISTLSLPCSQEGEPEVAGITEAERHSLCGADSSAARDAVSPADGEARVAEVHIDVQSSESNSATIPNGEAVESEPVAPSAHQGNAANWGDARFTLLVPSGRVKTKPNLHQHLSDGQQHTDARLNAATSRSMQPVVAVRAIQHQDNAQAGTAAHGQPDDVAGGILQRPARLVQWLACSFRDSLQDTLKEAKQRVGDVAQSAASSPLGGVFMRQPAAHVVRVVRRLRFLP